jgi:hypothetical protein
VGDRSILAQEANLIDIEQRYGDVIDLSEALERARHWMPATSFEGAR